MSMYLHSLCLAKSSRVECEYGEMDGCMYSRQSYLYQVMRIVYVVMNVVKCSDVM